MRAGKQVDAGARTGVASQTQVREVEAGDDLVEADRDGVDGRVAWVGRDFADDCAGRGAVERPGFGRVRNERVRRGVGDSGTARGEREREGSLRVRDARQIAECVGHAAVARRQRLRAGEQVTAAVASQRQVSEVEAGDDLVERDRDAADRCVAWIG